MFKIVSIGSINFQVLFSSPVGLWALTTASELPVPSIEDIINSEEVLATEGNQKQLGCLVQQAKIPEECMSRVNKITIG